MLVLSRQRNESIVIGSEVKLEDNTVVTVVDVRGDKARLGIESPKNVPVHRKEVWVRIQEENAQAAPKAG